jgi:hypothetical protein
LVIVWTATGAPPPIWTPPTFTERSEATPPVYEPYPDLTPGRNAHSVHDRKEVRMKRTTLAVALATGALAVPAVALAAGNDASPSATQSPSATPAPQQRDQAPQRGRDCPDHDGSGSSSGSGGQTSL